MFIPENPLEELLAVGGQSPEKALEFYRELLNAKVVTLGRFDSNPKTQDDYQRIQPGDKFNFRLVAYQNEPVVAVFTSVKRMTDVIPENYYRETGYIQVTCRDLLLTAASFGKPTPVVLNPGHMRVMLIAPERVKALLDGSLFKQIEEARAAGTGPSTVTIPKGERIIVGKPKVVPTNLMNKLAEYFQTSRNVERAWVGEILVPSSGQPAHLLVCIRLSNNSQRTFDQFSVDIGPTIRSGLGQKEFLDVTDANTQTKELLDKLIPFFPK
jgi:hypothetical protein